MIGQPNTEDESAELSPDDEEAEGEGEDSIQQSAFKDEEDLRAALIRRGSMLTITLTKVQADELANRIIRDVSEAEADLTIFKEMRTEYLAAWRGVVEPKEFPFEGAANIRVPMTSFFVEQQKSRLRKALLGGKYIAEFSTTDGSLDQDQLTEVNDWFQYELTEIVDIDEAFVGIAHDALVYGIALPVPEYCREYKDLVEVRNFTIDPAAPIEAQLYTALDQVFGEDMIGQPTVTGKGTFKVTFQDDDKDQILDAKVSFFLRGQTLTIECLKQKMTYDGVKVPTINMEDIVCPNSSTHIDKLPYFVNRYWISVHEFMAGLYDKKSNPNGIYRIDGSDKNDEEAIEAVKCTASARIGTIVSQEVTELSD